jgi:hypothetical protein
MARQHFARDLRVAWLVGADQADDLQSGEEEEAAEDDQRQDVDGTAGAFVEGLRVFLFGGGERDGYCTLSG